MWSPARFAQSRWARRGVEALLWSIFAVASITLLARIIAGFLSPLPASRALLNASSFTFLSLILLMVSYSRGSAALKRVSSQNYGGLALGVIAAVAVASYLPSLRDPFLFDDYTHLSNAARQAWSEMLASALFKHPAAGDPFFRPLGYISYWLDYHWAGYHSERWHLWNVLVHAANSILVYLFSAQLPLSRRGSIFAALVFAVHASHAEATGWMAARFDLFAFLFSLMALIALHQFLSHRRPVWLAAMVLATLLAVLSKESAFCLPLMALCMIPFRRVDALKIAKLAGVMAAVCVSVFLYRAWFLGGIGGYTTDQGTPAILNFHVLGTLNALLFRMWGLFLFPLNWSVLPGTWLIPASAFMLLAAALFLMVSRADRSRLLAALGLILAAALPVQHLLLIGPDFAGARVLYLPTLGLALFWGVVFDGCDNSRLAFVLSACVLLFQWGALQHNLRLRTETAELSRRACLAIGEELRRDTRPIMAEGLPRTWNGVYFLSTGFIPCVAIQSGMPQVAGELYVDPAIAAAAARPPQRIFIWSAAAHTLLETH